MDIYLYKINCLNYKYIDYILFGILIQYKIVIEFNNVSNGNRYVLLEKSE